TVFTDNLVAWNVGTGPAAYEKDVPVTPSYDAYFDNTSSDASWPAATGELFGVDPELPGWTAGACSWEALVRSRTSPLLDAGDPAEPDPDGGPTDIGALGGPGAPAVDADGDGTDYADDCDDLDPTSYPGATDTPGDGIDQDCDGADAGSGTGDT